MYVDERLAEIFAELQPGRDRGGQRGELPAVVTGRGALGAHRVVQPARAARPGSAAHLLGLPGGRPLRLGRVPRRVPPHPRRRSTRLRRVGALAGGARLSASSISSTSRPTSTSTCIPEEADYPRARPLGDRWQRLDSCVRAADADFELPGGGGRRRPPRLPEPGQPRLGRRRADAAAGRRPGENRPPRDREQGTAARPVELRDGMWGEEFVPQPAILPQVDLVITHGGNNTVTESLPLRQADDRAAAVLGPVRQRPARAGDRARRAPARPSSGTRASSPVQSTPC